MQIKYLYVAGPLTPTGDLSSNPAINYLLNMRRMIKLTLKAIFAGFVPFCPALDFLYFLLLEDGERIKEPQIKKLSKDWLMRCDAILLCEGWERSAGTLAEIEAAKKRGMLVFKSLDEVLEYNKKQEEKR